MSKTPKIPEEQTSFAGDKTAGREGKTDRRDLRTDVRDGQPGDAGINTAEQGRFGDIKQNTTHQGYQQDR
ncbi:hypothetical protein GGQ87_001677 [Brevundimonas alba]|uniref:Uncharacterized protein n=1 Tax=Brevundimonas alba TaxID=74314 RepID=A0A7X6BNY9_9CAUL|nr:hypothetical protein [Brevundimonas alba]NJC41419.1 hypothetical protein [Brevundimonas alba]